MAILKTGNGNGNYFNEDAKELLIHYILRPDKVVHGYFGGVGVDPLCPAESMELVSEQFRKQDGVQLRHFIVSFTPYELADPAVVNEIAQQVTIYIGHALSAFSSCTKLGELSYWGALSGHKTGILCAPKGLKRHPRAVRYL